MRTHSSFFSHGLLLLLCSVGVALVGAGIWLIQPSFSDVTYRVDGGEDRTGLLPLLIDTTKNVSIDMRFTMKLGMIHTSTFVLTADDCATHVTVNDTPIHDDFSASCYWSMGKQLDLEPYVHAGINDVRLRINDNGGKGGAGLRVSWTDPLLLFLILCEAILLACTLRLLLLLFRIPPGAQQLTLLLLAALALRIGLAFHPGHGSDLGLNKNWARTAATQGPAALYDMSDGMRDTDYPPLSILIFGASGWVYTQFSPDHSDYQQLEQLLIKMPAILADLGVILLLWSLFAGLYRQKTGLIAGAIYAFHPAALYDSAIWGQTDSLFTLAMMGSLLAAIRGRWWLTGACAAAAFLLKAQALVLFPALLLIALFNWRQIIHIAAGAMVTTAAVLLPYALKGTVPGVIDVYVHSVGAYKNLSVGAFNIWRAFYADRVNMEDTSLFFGIVSMRTVGLLLFASATAAVFLVLWRALHNSFLKRAPRDLLTPFLAVGLTSAAFFLFNTEMHERYLFPFIVLAIPLCFLGWQGVVLYVSMSLLFALNLMVVLPFGTFDGRLWNEFPGLPVSIGALQTVLFVVTLCFVGWIYRPFLSTTLRVHLRRYGLYPAAWASAAVRK